MSLVRLPTGDIVDTESVRGVFHALGQEREFVLLFDGGFSVSFDQPDAEALRSYFQRIEIVSIDEASR